MNIKIAQRREDFKNPPERHLKNIIKNFNLESRNQENLFIKNESYKVYRDTTLCETIRKYNSEIKAIAIADVNLREYSIKYLLELLIDCAKWNISFVTNLMRIDFTRESNNTKLEIIYLAKKILEFIDKREPNKKQLMKSIDEMKVRTQGKNVLCLSNSWTEEVINQIKEMNKFDEVIQKDSLGFKGLEISFVNEDREYINLYIPSIGASAENIEELVRVLYIGIINAEKIILENRIITSKLPNIKFGTIKIFDFLWIVCNESNSHLLKHTFNRFQKQYNIDINNKVVNRTVTKSISGMLEGIRNGNETDLYNLLLKLREEDGEFIYKDCYCLENLLEEVERLIKLKFL